MAWLKQDYSANLVANYKFNEATGATCIDSKSAYNGIYTGTTSITDASQGVSNTYRTFNGTTDYIQFANQVIPLGKKSIKFKMKCSIKTGSYDGRIFDNSEGSVNFGTLIQVKANTGFLHWGIGKGVNGSYNFSMVSTVNVCDGNWHTILLTWDGTINNNSAKMYIDDMMLPHMVTTATVAETTNASYNLRLGNQATGVSFNNAFIGALDEIEIYNDVIEFRNKKYLIQDKNNILWRVNELKYTENVIPAMTSNNSGSIVVSASNSYGSDYPYKAVDRLNNATGRTFWYSTVAVPQWWQIDFGLSNEKAISKYTIAVSKEYTPPDYSLKEWRFEGSNDLSNWDVLDYRNNVSWSIGEKKEFIAYNYKKYRYYRIYILQANASLYPMIGEIEMMEVATPHQIDKLNETNLIDTLFINKGIDESKIVNNLQPTQKGIYALDKGTIGSGKLFEFSLEDSFNSIINIE